MTVDGPVEATDIRAELDHAGKVWAKARRAERAAASIAREVATRADAAGVSEVQIATALGTFRTTVRAWLGKGGAKV